jgi:ubiquinone/menaquinone biosynthesis C-methylase UbiE
LRDGAIVLDGGVGPGTTSRLILARIKPRILIGLDGSAKQIAAAKVNLAEYSDLLQFVRASFEFIPFRESIFDGIITCYALRDSLDLSKSISEYSRVCAPRGVFADVDIGKSDNTVKRLMGVLYVKFLMPLLAKMAIWRRMKSNPWRMIGPTFDTLPKNKLLLGIMRRQFPNIQTKEFLTGGVIVIIGRKS